MADLKHYLDRFPGLRIAVVGDLMLDKYIFGDATRISQEAPVPVVHVQRQHAVPGGAANVARNVVSLGAQAEVFGIVGDDYDGEALLNSLNGAGIDTSGVLAHQDSVTTVKTRVIAANQQVVRIDTEHTCDAPRSIHRRFLKQLEGRLASGEIHALILEDYAKGLFNKWFMEQIVELCRKYRIYTALDPHSSHPFNVKGLDMMTPNRSEAYALAAIPSSRAAAESSQLGVVGKKLIGHWGLKNLLITLGANGMALFDSTHPAAYTTIPTVARQVFDVSGAGDTVMAAIVLAIMAQAPIQDACQIANAAAGIVVGRIGTSAIEADVLKQAL